MKRWLLALLAAGATALAGFAYIHLARQRRQPRLSR